METERENGQAVVVRRQAVIFDLDGVLVDSFGVMRQAFTIAYAEVVGDGLAPFEEYERHLGRYFPDIMRIMNLPLEMEEPFVRESYRLASEVVLFDGVAHLLRTLRERGYGLAVATGKAGSRARHLLGVLGVLDLFDHVIGSDEIARPKPAPDIVLHALALLGADASTAVMIGDAVADLDSARGAGVMAAAALWGETDGVELIAAAPDAVLHRPSDLLVLLGESSPIPAGTVPAPTRSSGGVPEVPAARTDVVTVVPSPRHRPRWANGFSPATSRRAGPRMLRDDIAVMGGRRRWRPGGADESFYRDETDRTAPWAL